MAERAREAIELQARADLRPAGFGDRPDEEVEFLYDEAERDDRDARPDPGEESPLVRGVVGVSLDHRDLSGCWGPLRPSPHERGDGRNLGEAEDELQNWYRRKPPSTGITVPVM